MFNIVNIVNAASSTDAQPQPSTIAGFFPVILIFVIFYFLLIRPQQKKQKDHQTMLSSIKNDDVISINSGIIGKVIKISNDDDVVELEISEEVHIKVYKWAISGTIADKQKSKK